jgi:uncharacterized YigZ family protein
MINSSGTSRYIKNTDEYLSIAGTSKGLYKEKGSKFIAYAYPVNKIEQIDDILTRLKKKYHDARHHCYAYVLGPDREEYRVYDNGEPVNTAGKPILNQINLRKLTNVIVVVIRYFGGIMLGKGGLTRAYKQAADNVLQNASIVKIIQKETYRLCFDLQHINNVMKIIGESNLDVISQKFEQLPEIKISIRKNNAPDIINKFRMINNIKIEHLGNE